MWRVDLQVDGLSVDALVAARYATGLALNLPLDILKVIPFPMRLMVEFCPLILPCYAGWRVWDVYFVMARLVVSAAWEVDELKDERSSSYDAAATREKVSADDVLQYGRLS